MKLKKILALAVSLAMVLSIVPAFGLTASAADYVKVNNVNYVVVGENLVPDGGFEDADGNFSWGTWFSPDGTNGYFKDKCDGWFYIVNRDTNAAVLYGDSLDAEDYALGTRWNDGSAGLCSLANNIPVKEGNTYLVSYDYKHKTAGISLGYIVTSFVTSESVSTDGTNLFSSLANTTTSWQTAETVFTAPSDGYVFFHFRWLGEGSNSGNGPYWYFDNFTVEQVEEVTSIDVTATYTVGDQTVDTVTSSYPVGAAGATFPAKYVYYDGEVYGAEETTLSADATIPMSVVPHYASKAENETFTYDGSKYEVTGGSVVVNGNFITGDTSAWTNRPGTAITGATVAYDEEIGGNALTISTSGASATNSIGTSWNVTAGQTYYLSFYAGGAKPDSANYTYNRVFQSDRSTEIVAYGANMTNGAWKRFETVFTPTGDTIYFQGSWAADIKYANVELLPVELVEAGSDVTVSFVNEAGDTVKSVSDTLLAGESIEVPAGEVFTLDGIFYDIPETTASETTAVTVYPVANKYGVLEDALVSDNEIWGVKAANENSVFVAAGDDANRAPLADANGDAVTDGVHTPSTLGKSRVGFVEFPVVDLEEGQKAIANFYVRTWHGNTFSNSNTSIRLAAYVLNDSSWAELSDGQGYDSANAPILETYPNAIFSEAHGNYVDYITFDVTDAMKAAKAAGLEKFDLRLNSAWGAAYIAEREAAIVGGAYEGKAAYIEVVDAGAFEVTNSGLATLTKNGSAVGATATVTADDDVRLVSDGAIVIATDNGNYIPNTNLGLTAATDLGLATPYAFGINLVNGAQVRVGDGVTAENKVGNGSGLRFIATVDSNASNVIAEEYGMEITAQGSDKVVKVPATEDQADGVFTVALTNLAESNYNREYTATPYVTVKLADGTEETFRGASVTRSIYAVSAGLLLSGEYTADSDNYELSDVVKSVLNAYVNQTGIRLAYSKADGFTAAADSYTGDVVFTVAYNDNEDGSYTVAIAPRNAENIDLAAAEAWWLDYVRVNNNNSVAKTYISDASFDRGVLQFTFTFPAAE